MLEYVLAKRIIDFFDRNNFFCENQHGYRKRKSTTTAVHATIQAILEAIDEKKQVELIGLDLSKAFDNVKHDLLLDKLYYYGIRGPTFDIIKSYLNNRKQIIKINDLTSSMEEICQGVPQGSILGPLLFIIYVNDMPDQIKCGELCLYADDTTIVSIASTAEELQECSGEALRTAQQWYNANGLTLNNEKTQKLLFNKTTDNKSLKFLGVHMDAELKWTAHTQELSKSLNSAIFCIRRIKNIVTPEAAKLVYYSTFHSRLSYGVLFWGTSSSAQRIFLLQKRALRVLLGLAPLTSCREYFLREKILTLPAIYILSSIQHIKENMSAYETNDYNHEYMTRHGHDLRTPWHRTKKTQDNVAYWGAKIYNHLPKDMRCLPTKMLIYEIKKKLLKTCIYSLDEYFECF